MSYDSYAKEWFERNFTVAYQVPNEGFRRSLYLMLIESFAQMSTEYSMVKDNKKCFREFVLKYSSLRDELLLVCPATLYYDYKDQYQLPKPDLFSGRIYYYTEAHLCEEAERLLLCIPEEKREAARNRHQYVNLLYQMRSKLIHEQRLQGTGVNFSDTYPQVSSGFFPDVDENDEIINIQVTTLNFPEKYISSLTWETVENYLAECEREDRNPIPPNFNSRKCELSWYD